VVVIQVKRTAVSKIAVADANASTSAATDIVTTTTVSGKLVLVDLAGSERLASTLHSAEDSASSTSGAGSGITAAVSSVASWFGFGKAAAGAHTNFATSASSAPALQHHEARLKESQAINTSLAALEKVFSQLSGTNSEAETVVDASAEGGKKALTTGGGRHISYRDSKLTHSLADCLGGGARTVLLACVSPAAADAQESLCTLGFAARARNIKQTVLDNVTTSGTSSGSSGAAVASAVLPKPGRPQTAKQATASKTAGSSDADQELPATAPAPANASAAQIASLQQKLAACTAELAASREETAAARQQVAALSATLASLRAKQHKGQGQAAPTPVAKRPAPERDNPPAAAVHHTRLSNASEGAASVDSLPTPAGSDNHNGIMSPQPTARHAVPGSTGGGATAARRGGGGGRAPVLSPSKGLPATTASAAKRRRSQIPSRPMLATLGENAAPK
jgi:hypothetical protein